MLFHHLCHGGGDTAGIGKPAGNFRAHEVIGVALVPFCLHKGCDRRFVYVHSCRADNAVATLHTGGTGRFQFSGIFAEPPLHVAGNVVGIELVGVGIAKERSCNVVGTENGISYAWT